ncbi:heavy-metal-associated domain-containing protein [Atopobacter phocae]|uniref:heavy-metal-associated domain-containing protein n=1 Tax=Atopobacter phocae TaxID=136492 RepID=UPI0004700C62|nr:heavy-metal-associated domain-containing protein [Atopobacter phocae]
MKQRQYQIAGMNCKHCVVRVEQAVASITGVSQVHVELEPGRLELLADEGIVSDQLIQDAVSNAGYQAKPMQ